MADWQGELESLLATLNVSLEGPPALKDETDEDAAREPLGFVEQAAEPTGTAELDASGSNAETLLEVVPVDGDEISAVRSEIEATIARVVALVRAGRMDRALRDDVVFVLEALTRPRPGQGLKPLRPAGPDDSNTEWNLASAAAVLRFCRIVVRLANALAQSDDLGAGL